MLKPTAGLGIEAPMAAIMVYAAIVYLALGVAFAIPFVVRGAGVVDSGARDAPWSFRLLILPGAAALWPLMLMRWLSGVRAGPGAHP